MGSTRSASSSRGSSIGGGCATSGRSRSSSWCWGVGARWRSTRSSRRAPNRPGPGRAGDPAGAIPGAAPGTMPPDPTLGPQGRFDPRGAPAPIPPLGLVARGASLVDWAPDDSVIRALMARRGYTAVRYQAGQVRFEAAGRLMTLQRDSTARAAVQRDSTLLVADRIAYSDSLKRVDASGDTIVMRDPARGGRHRRASGAGLRRGAARGAHPGFQHHRQGGGGVEGDGPSGRLRL